MLIDEYQTVIDSIEFFFFFFKKIENSEKVSLKVVKTDISHHAIMQRS